MECKHPKKFSVLKIIAFESGTKNSLNLEKDISHWKSMSYKKSLRSDISQREIFFTVRFYQHDGKIWWKCSHADFTTFWDPLTCWLSKCVLKQCFLESSLTKSFKACSFRNKVAMTIIIFSKMFKISCRFHKWIKKIRKIFWFLR